MTEQEELEIRLKMLQVENQLFGPDSFYGRMDKMRREQEARWERLYIITLIATPIAIIIRLLFGLRLLYNEET